MRIIGFVLDQGDFDATMRRSLIATLIVACISLHTAGGDAGITPGTAVEVAAASGASNINNSPKGEGRAGQLSILAAGGVDQARKVCTVTEMRRASASPFLCVSGEVYPEG